MSDLPEKPSDDRHRLRVRWDSSGLDFDARGYGLVVVLVVLGAFMWWMLNGSLPIKAKQ